ncbi:hypothetical protein B0A48_08618 [Cryoendolithus antarcticus]|uniref:RRM domain-containing protein n=1 Tax=Cryoendolithus antarcticus TaxID=1507870 RepID=A0A1V8T3W7_9PEZI|nr:hypothetical protein B0A48_08618 [Cryoendolithus antarcticus]
MAPSVTVRKLHHSISDETVRGMFMFSGDLIDTEIVASRFPEDDGYATAIAHFRSNLGAMEARSILDGKPDPSGQSKLIVQMNNSVENGRRPTMGECKHQVDSKSPKNTNGLPSPSSGSSKLKHPWRSPPKISPPLPQPNGFASSSSSAPENRHLPELFSPRSPLANSAYDDRNRMSGKHFINGAGADEDTGRLLSDPVAYAQHNESSQRSRSEEQADFQAAFDRMQRLTLATNGASPPSMAFNTNYFESQRSPNGALQCPTSPTNITNMYNNGNNFYSPRRQGERQTPPPNPADLANSPCNTVYVGNLPVDVSEDELKQAFSRQRGYKRLVCRVKNNGPMCFVEFEDVTYATRAMNALSGHLLHNSVKGGLRLSYSKNPLGVRSSQNPNNMHRPQTNGGPNMQAAYGNGFANGSIAGPPPGLASPPGFTPANPATNGYVNGSASQNGYSSPPTNGYTNGTHRTAPTMNGHASPNPLGNAYAHGGYVGQQSGGNAFLGDVPFSPWSTGSNAFNQTFHYHMYDQQSNSGGNGDLIGEGLMNGNGHSNDIGASMTGTHNTSNRYPCRDNQQDPRQGFSDRNMGR